MRSRPLSEQIFAFSCFLAVAGYIAIYRFSEISNSKSFGWDSAAFLENGAVYAGFPQYTQAYDPTRPPVLPVILSIAFRITGPNLYDGYLVSGALYFLGMMGAYLLAREIMNPWLAILPAVSFGLAPMVIQWGGIDYSNVEGVAIASFGLATFVYAVKYHSAFYLLALPLLLLTPLTRYTLGIILFVAVVYVLAYRVKGDASKPISPLFFSLGLGIAILGIAGLGSIWLGYPLSHGYSLFSIFPTAGKLNPFMSPLGHFFWVINLPNELGTGTYMYLITSALVLSVAYLLFSPIVRSTKTKVLEDLRQPQVIYVPSITKSLPTRSQQRLSSTEPTPSTNPLVYALLFWFLALFLFYSIAWSYYDPRYSIEFIMPALIIASWGIDRGLSGLYHRAVGRESGVAGVKSNLPKKITAFLIIFLIGASVGFFVVQSGTSVVQNTPVVDTSLNAGMRQAASWVTANVPTNVRIEGDWYTFLWWYLPNYTILEAPAAYQLQSSKNYTTWLDSIYSNNVSYVIYSNSAAINVPSQFQPVFTSNVSGVTVFQVKGG